MPVGVFLLAAAFLVPGHYVPWISFQGEWIAALALAALTWTAARRVPRLSGADRYGFPHVAWLPLLWALIPLAQWASGRVVYLSDAAMSAAFLAAFGWAFVIGSVLSPDGGRERWVQVLALAFVAAGTVSVGIALAQWLLKPASLWMAELPPGQRPFANLAQPNQLATLLALASIGGIHLFERGTLGRASACVLGTWLVFGLAMTRSRTTFIIFALWIMWRVLTRGRFRRRTGWIAVASAVALYCALFMGWEAINRLIGTGVSETLAVRINDTSRLWIWSTMLRVSTRQAALGYGFNQTSAAQVASSVDTLSVGAWFDSAHNLLIDLLIWQGWPLTLALTASVMFWITRRLRLVGDGPPVEIDTLWSWFVALATYSMLEFPYRFLYFLIPAGLIAGAIDRYGRASGPAEHGRRFPARVRASRAVLHAAAASILVAAVVVAVDYLRVEESYRRLRMAMLGVGRAEDVLAQAPVSPLMDGPLAFQRFMLTPARSGLSANEWHAMRDAALRQPMPPALLRLALAAGLNDRPNEAAGYLRAICHMNTTPRCVEARESWTALRAQHPVLQSIPLPEIPPRP